MPYPEQRTALLAAEQAARSRVTELIPPELANPSGQPQVATRHQ